MQPRLSDTHTELLMPSLWKRHLLVHSFWHFLYYIYGCSVGHAQVRDTLDGRTHVVIVIKFELGA
jgi:hypothetical protein